MSKWANKLMAAQDRKAAGTYVGPADRKRMREAAIKRAQAKADREDRERGSVLESTLKMKEGYEPKDASSVPEGRD